ncbi:MFS general substrate transporter [Aspergillus costaricaensis CBS 115574]|uniref:MFS general substrate transporter n=1 Tax=Aspergillus costaricaensis CBS 115574 TaxID=1448317 RepID=A0ACD1IK64_9EURO|nr:MFS general substrate transporter [Aspergillus costaricaensis CBS 115574]RAK90415.1 MFS general substrate transporter [Aspergillus costaricaensis CBS 115574]
MKLPRARVGWLCVFGSFMGLVGSLGLVNSTGIFQAYLELHQLRQHGSGQTGWIFGLFTFLTFFCGIQIGPIFDTRGPRLLVFLGLILIMVMMVSIGFCHEYSQFILTIGVAGGFGTLLIFTPSIAAVGHFFQKKRGLVTGIAVSGGSIKGVIILLILESLFNRYGFAWATRVITLVCLIFLVITSTLVSSRLLIKPFSKENTLPDFQILWECKFLLTIISIFFIKWSLFIPITYISSYALAHGSFFGRLLSGLLTDSISRFNILIITIAFCLICNACLWMPAGDSITLLIIYCALFGFVSKSNISLTPVCIGQLCWTEYYGHISILTGVLIAGEILT